MSGLVITGARGDVWREKGHGITIGGARSGKGAALILPAMLHNGLSQPDAPSFVFLDPKGENIAVAGRHLLNCGYRVMALNPFGIRHVLPFENVRFNPFDLIDPNGRDFFAHVDFIRHSIIVPQKTQHANSYFSEAASDILSLYISHMMTQRAEPRNMRTLYRWLRLTGEGMDNLFRSMARNDAYTIKEDALSLYDKIANGTKSIGEVFSNVTTATSMFRDPNLLENMSSSDFNIADIPHKKTALFICLSASDLDRMDVWLRLAVGSIMNAMEKVYNPYRKVVFLMDEFATMGRLIPYERGMGYLAGFNVTLWPILQDLNQLKALYPSWETFVGNAAFRHWMVNDNFSAEYLEKRMPNDVVFLGSNSDGSPRYERKRLLTAEEIMSFPHIIMEMSGVRGPIRLSKIPYWRVTENGSPNPFY